MSGSIGCESTGLAAETAFDHESRSWVFSTEEHDVAAVSVFAFDGRTNTLAILKHESFREMTLAKVLTNILNNGEKHLAEVTTDWDVDPKLDKQGFFDWIRSVDQVSRLRFVAKLPNPDPADEFELITERMDAMQARILREEIEARSDETGLTNIDKDPQIRGYLAMADKAYGYVSANGCKNDRPARYDQRNQVKRQSVGLPETWPDLLSFMWQFMLSRRGDDEAS
jgi:hypothetical protein